MKNRQVKRCSSGRGFISLEIAGALIVILVMLGLIAWRMGFLQSTSGTAEEFENAQALLTNTRNLKSANGYGTSGTSLLASLSAQKAIPANMTYSGGVLSNSYGGTVTDVSTGGGYTLTENSVPQSDCITLAEKMSNSGVYTTTINTNAAITGAVDAPTATTQCSSATSNTIAWTSAS